MIVKRFAIDLTWVRHGVVGGTELFACNIIDGFLKCLDENPGTIQIFLLTAKDNIEVFRRFHHPEVGMKCIKCNTESANRKSRVIWQNLKMRKTLRDFSIDTVLEPIYYKPFLGTKGIRYFTVIHDLQGWHYPQYFSKLRVLWMKFCWKYSVHSSVHVVATSNFVRNDIIDKIGCSEDKVVTIPIPIVIGGVERRDDILDKYGVKKSKYYFTVSSMLPHKNLCTLIKGLALLKQKNSSAFYPLVISGVGERPKELSRLIDSEGLSEDILFTGYISDSDRNCLYSDCRAFLFPSIFEGFGMPPVEALALGVPVITTEKTSLREVTGGLACYVRDALEPEAWAMALELEPSVANHVEVRVLMKRYESKTVAEKYLKLIRGL